jgi:hypothetical protein
MIEFIVWDIKNNKRADVEEIAGKEVWAKGLCYSDMEGFAITENDSLVLLDECGNYAVCPQGRFEVRLI